MTEFTVQKTKQKGIEIGNQLAETARAEGKELDAILIERVRDTFLKN